MGSYGARDGPGGNDGGLRWESRELAAEGAACEEACKTRMGPRRIERGWQAGVQKKLFAKIHPLMFPHSSILANNHFPAYLG